MDFGAYTCKNLVVVNAPLSAADTLASAFGAVRFCGKDGRLALITAELSERAMADLMAKVGTTYPVVSRIRLL